MMTFLADTAPPTASRLEVLKEHLMNFGEEYGYRLVGALIILLLGLLLARFVGKWMRGWLERQSMEPPVRMLLLRIVRLGIIAFTLVSVLEKFGVPVSSLIAGMSVAGLGAGLALQGLLSNLFAGLSIIFTKPFRVGEYIELGGHSGEVSSIELFTTTLAQMDTSMVIMPNRNIVGEVLRNYGVIRQTNMTVGVSYDSNMSDVMFIIDNVLKDNRRVLKNPAPGVGIASLGQSAINISIQPFVSLKDFGAAQAEIYPELLKRFAASGINIPFPQCQVHLVKQEEPVKRK